MRPVKVLDRTWVDMDSVMAVSEPLAWCGNSLETLAEMRKRGEVWVSHRYLVQLTLQFRDKPLDIYWEDWSRYSSVDEHIAAQEAVGDSIVDLWRRA